MIFFIEDNIFSGIGSLQFFVPPWCYNDDYISLYESDNLNYLVAIFT